MGEKEEKNVLKTNMRVGRRRKERERERKAVKENWKNWNNKESGVERYCV